MEGELCQFVPCENGAFGSMAFNIAFGIVSKNVFTAVLFTRSRLNVSNGVSGSFPCRCEYMCHLRFLSAAAHYVSELHYAERCAADIYRSNLVSVNSTDRVLCHGKHINELDYIQNLWFHLCSYQMRRKVNFGELAGNAKQCIDFSY